MEFETVVDPLSVIDDFRKKAEDAGLSLPECMTLATVDSSGQPRARVLLLKGRAGRAFHFFTNYQSAKVQELDANPRAALCFHYPSLALQARVEGRVSRMSPEESDAYFASRPRESQIGAWASQQSRELSSRRELDLAVAREEARFAGKKVPRPPHWGGLSLVAEVAELWLGQLGRLHDRARYDFDGSAWRCRRLFP